MRAARHWVLVATRERGASLKEARQAWLDKFEDMDALERFVKRVQRDAVRSERKKLALRAQQA